MASREQLGNRPIYTNYLKGYSKHKTSEGFSLDSAYFKRYYSSLDAEIYFGNEFVDEIVGIDWTINQRQEPLFGYNSYVFDEVALGSRIISGSFAINFTSPRYLFRLLEVAQADSIFALGQYEITKTAEENTIVEMQSPSSLIDIDGNAPLWPQSFDIDIIFGEKTSKGTPVHLILEDVRISNCRSGLNTSGEPTIEIYNFIAKDIKTVE